MIELLIPALIAIAVTLVVISTRQIVTEVPNDDRQYMDPPPRFYRLTWPLVRFVAHYCGWALSEAAATRIQQALRRAGQDYTLTPVQFFAGKLVAAGTVSASLGWGTSAVGQGALVGVIAGAVFGFLLP